MVICICCALMLQSSVDEILEAQLTELITNFNNTIDALYGVMMVLIEQQKRLVQTSVAAPGQQHSYPERFLNGNHRLSHWFYLLLGDVCFWLVIQGASSRENADDQERARVKRELKKLLMRIKMKIT